MVREELVMRRTEGLGVVCSDTEHGISNPIILKPTT